MALPISGTYNFQSISTEELIIEAYELVGYPRPLIEPEKLVSALRSLNFVLLRWMNKGVNLWTLKTAFLPLKENQIQYSLLPSVSNIVQINTRTFTRQLDGIAGSSSGIADDAFDNDPYTSCNQDAPNGHIDYAYSQPPGDITQTITMVGITSFVTRDYTIEVVSNGHYNPNRFVTLLSIPKQTYTAGVTLWFDIPFPTNGPVIFIREIGGATLNIQELYFTNQVTDIQMSDVSRDDYFSYSVKYTASRPSSYYVDLQPNNPLLNIYPAPTSIYPLLTYSFKQMMTDAVAYTDTIELPSKFYPALVSELAKTLALKAESLGITISPDKAAILQSEAQMTWLEASTENSESIPMGFELDMSRYI